MSGGVCRGDLFVLYCGSLMRHPAWIDRLRQALFSRLSAVARGAIQSLNFIFNFIYHLPSSRTRSKLRCRSQQLGLNLGDNMKGKVNQSLPILTEMAAFAVFLAGYLFRRFLSLVVFTITRLPFHLAGLISTLKFHFVRKLVWGRGGWFSSISNFGLLALASAVFVTGGLLSGTTLVRSSSGFDNNDFVSAADVLASYQNPQTEIPSDRPRSETIDYVVEGGDTLSSIGEKFKISGDAIRYANNLSDENFLSVGQKLSIPPVSGIIYTVKAGDTVEGIAAKYKVAAQAIADFNYIVDNSDLKVGQKIVLPEAEIPPIPPKFVAPPLAYRGTPNALQVPLSAYNEPGSPGVVPGASGSFGWPVGKRYISQYFYNYHLGIDIPGNSGDPIYAADGGRVARSGWWPGGFGNAVKIDHGNGLSTMYAHMSSIEVSVGQEISKGQLIGRVGNTGRSFGSHLHLAVQQNGRYLNPLTIF